MATEVDIANLALSFIRAGTISSFDENSLQAKQCRLQYPILRDQMLQESNWNFASGIKPLAELETDVFNWAYVYQYPSDCLHINRAIPDFEEISQDNKRSGFTYPYGYEYVDRFDSNRSVEYQVLNQDGVKVVVSNYQNLRIFYRFRVTDTEMFTFNFVQALAHLLAAHISIPLVGIELGRQLRVDELNIYQSYINTAVNSDMNEQKVEVPDSDFVNVRH